MEKLTKSSEIYIMDHSLVTPNLAPEVKVYGEKLVDFKGKEYRIWDPRRSKLAAAILNGMDTLEIYKDSKVLYLGASSGTTPSHISDLVVDGLLYAVEFSPRMMRELLRVCEKRENMVPLLEDATRPHRYLNLLEKVDLIYCDVAQPQQSELFMENMRLFLKKKGRGIIMIKSRSIDVTQKPQKIFKNEEKKLKSAGFKILEKVKLEPYEKDHLAMVVELSF
ncbi:fibrillarin-like rRNA/tRNA 2'-O-methyltransferase [Methanobacterium alkalithermotolerans]|uniref:Fibrillarin-like rRNA/tRNA 2'-O-methyltransferase n=1 Tax=Methanobacterium alkalithermotolerans TaxID=2731220 RepID=A0A8T8K5U9_9EURY|nr:fibrillarin-like rRNA/tRNA 2'-O-methyltransferase [Methanobacterium alkalithermotolerans]QUH23212.1 fibrillarin-like rRNA/tRNA 2'-O-methyltransferase [Methanobacterium alkalithermotolerans]RJS49208.1 MAG: fibrillarin [Methanobacterium sp.]